MRSNAFEKVTRRPSPGLSLLSLHSVQRRACLALSDLLEPLAWPRQPLYEVWIVPGLDGKFQ